MSRMSYPGSLAVSPARMPVLRGFSRPVERVTDTERRLLAEMVRVMSAADGIGLAAPQVGVALRLVVVDIGDGPRLLVNPQVERRGRKTTIRNEGCLSLPEVSVPVRRAESVDVVARDEHDQPLQFTAEGLLARVIQHEVDHLEGILIVDYLPLMKRRTVCRRLGIGARRDFARGAETSNAPQTPFDESLLIAGSMIK